MSAQRAPQDGPQAGPLVLDAGPAALSEPTGEPLDSWLAVGASAAPRAARRPASEVPLALLESTFESALGELHLVFQPIVVADTLAPFGHEALMRCDHELLSSPGDLLDAAERLHRVDRLGRAIRRKVAAHMRAADGEGLVFVNLHALELLDRSLWSPYTPLGKLRRRIVLEITERASLEVVDDARYRVAELREMGYRIAIDDLGAGHSRMNRFTLRDTDFVKLDMSLVRDLDKHPRRRRLVATIISMCRDQNIRVVGEGVETRAERDVLVELGCDLLQGFLIARPGPDLQGSPTTLP